MSAAEDQVIPEAAVTPPRSRTLPWMAAAAGRLALWLPAGWPDSGLPLRWRWRGAGQELKGGEIERLSDLPDEVRGASLQVWTPGDETLLTRATVPTRSRAKILQALPYALEDQLIGEPHDMFLVYQAEPDGSLAVAVTARARLDNWLGALKAGGLQPDSLCPDALLPAFTPGVWRLHADSVRVLVRTGGWSGFVCRYHPDQPPALLRLAVNEARERGQAPTAFEWCGDRPVPGAWAAALGGELRQVEPSDLLAPPPLNMLQREYAPPARRSAGLARRFLPAAVMLGAWLTIGLVMDIVEVWRLSRTASAQQQQMIDLFRRSFPEASAVVDAPKQMQDNLAALEAGSGELRPQDLLALLARSAGVFTGQSSLRLRSLQYDGAGLTVEVTVADYQAVEALSVRLKGQGLKVETLSANARGAEVDGRLRIQAGSAR